VTGTGYRGHPAPLEKYDYVTSGSYNGPATSIGRSLYYDRQAPHWYGLCYAWAAAAILEPEPTDKGIYGGVVFRVGDKKALLTVLHDSLRYNSYNVKDPVEFHNVLEEYIKRRGQPIIMDLGDQVEVWNYPVYRYDTSYTTEGNLRHYTTTVYFASDMVSPEYIGTQVSSKTYWYWFELNGSEIIDSGWEEASASAPPKRAYEPLDPVPRNDAIDPDKVQEIVGTIDDAYEDNDTFEQATPAISGRYDFLLLDEDWVKVNLRAGDQLKAMIDSEDSTELSAQFLGTGERVEVEMPQGQWITYVAKDNGDHYIRVSTENTDDEYEYSLYIEQGLKHQAIFPMYQPGGWVNGLSIISPQAGPNTRTILCLLEDRGAPAMGYILDGTEGYMGGVLEEDFSLSSSAKGYLRVDSDNPLVGSGSEIYGTYFAFGGDLIPLDLASTRLYFPHFAGVHGLTGEWRTYFGLINIGEENEDIVLTAYGENGTVVGEDQIALGSGERKELLASSLGILKGGAKSLSAKCDSGRAVLLGYIKFENPNWGKGQAMIPLPLEESTHLAIPHVAMANDWVTSLALMNCGDNVTKLTLNAYGEGGGLLETSNQELKAHQNFVKVLSHVFSTSPAQIKSVEIVSNGNVPLCGFSLYATFDENRLSGQPLISPNTLPIYAPCADPSSDWATGIGITNTGGEQANVRLVLFDEAGEEISDKPLQLAPHEHYAATVKKIFGPNGGGKYMKIESDDPGTTVSGIYVLGSISGTKLIGGVFKGE